jgi:hypothetical protein
MQTLPALIAVVVGLAFGGLCALAVHEAGHLAAGRLGGLRPVLLVVGPMHLQFGDGLRVRPNTDLGSAGGIAVAVPQEGTNLRRAYLMMIAGGPTASLLAGLLAVATFAGFGMAFGANATVGRSLLYVMGSAALFIGGIISLGLALVTAVPYKLAIQASDGARILTLLRNDARADRAAAVLALSGYWLAGAPPRNWPSSVVRRATALDDGDLDDLLARYMAYLNALDIRNTDSARAQVERLQAMRATAPAAFRPVIDAESAYFAAAYTADADGAQRSWDRVQSSPLLDRYTRRRAEAAVLLATGQRDRGTTLLQEVIVELERQPALAGRDLFLGEMRRLAARASLHSLN